MRKAKINLNKIEQEKENMQIRRTRIIRAALIVGIVVCLVLIGIFIGHQIERNQNKNAARENYVAFDACRDDLNALAQYLQTCYDDEETRPEYLMVTSSDLRDSKGVALMMPPNLKTAVRNISSKGFTSDKFQWRMIRFQENRIQFNVSDGTYALVYSPEGKPTYLHDATEQYDILVEHIEGPWYHVARIS